MKKKNEKLGKYIKKNLCYLLSFGIPILLLIILYITRGIFPFGDNAYLRMDFYHQYAPFVKEFWNRMHSNEGILYAWENGLGTNYWAMYAYYLASPTNWLYLLVPRDYLIEAMNAFMILKGGAAGLCFAVYLRNRFKSKQIALVCFAAFYALSAYYLAYSCNIIWLDCFMLFPLVALGIYNIINKDSAALYFIAMGICTFSNFYIAVISGFCCVFFFVLCLLSGRRRKGRQIGKAVIKFVFSTLLYVCVCAVILIPVALALRNTPASGSAFPKEWELYFPIYQLFERMFMNASVSQLKSDFPNIYASVLAILLVPVYFCNSKILLKEKIASGLLILFLLVSFDLNVFDYIWHGFHFPNSFPARESFFYIFLILCMAYESFIKISFVKKAVIPIVYGLELVGIMIMFLVFSKPNEAMEISSYLCTIGMLTVFAVLFLMRKKMPKKVFTTLFLVSALTEVTVNMCVIGLPSFVTRSNYVENDKIMEETLSMLNEREEGFYRVEELDRKAVNDASWDGYYGASYFSSTMPEGLMRFYENFGMRTSNVSYSHDGATLLSSSLLGIKYLIGFEDRNLGSELVCEEVNTQNGSLFLYENRYALPLGFVIDKDMEEHFQKGEERNPFDTQNRFGTAVLSDTSSLFTPIPKQFGLNGRLSFQTNAGAQGDMEQTEDSLTSRPVCFMLKKGERAYLYVTSYVEEVRVVSLNLDTMEEKTQIFDDLKFRRILDLGVAQSDLEILVYPGDEEELSEVTFHAYKLNEEVLKRIYEKLKEEPLVNIEVNNTKVSATVNSLKGGTVFTSIPYDSGWSVYDNGEKVETHAWKDAFLSFDISSGEHELRFTYFPPGMKTGLLISTAGLLICLLLLSLRAVRKYGIAKEKVEN